MFFLISSKMAASSGGRGFGGSSTSPAGATLAAETERSSLSMRLRISSLTASSEDCGPSFPDALPREESL